MTIVSEYGMRAPLLRHDIDTIPASEKRSEYRVRCRVQTLVHSFGRYLVELSPMSGGFYAVLANGNRPTERTAWIYNPMSDRLSDGIVGIESASAHKERSRSFPTYGNKD